MGKAISGLSALAQQGVLLPQESVLEVGKIRKDLFIGIPRETSFQENRIPLVPDSIGLLVAHGHRVLVETNAGINANFTDSDFSEAGAQIAYSPEDIYKADLILKIAPPSQQELGYLKDKQSLFSILQIGMQPEGFIQQLSSKKITALAFEYLRDETNIYPVIQAMSEIVGSTVILIASELLSNTSGGKGELLGGVPGIPPTEVVIIGAGTVSEYAARAAMGLGANVKIFDTSVYKLRRIQRNLGSRVHTSVINPSALLKALKTCDVAIGAILSKEGRSPIIVTEEMVSEMRFGSVVIDVSIDKGGCFETSHATTHADPTFVIDGIVHYCVANMPGAVPLTSSHALNHATLPFGLALADHGLAALAADPHLRAGLNIHRGKVTHRAVAESLGLAFADPAGIAA